MSDQITGARWWRYDFHTHTPASNDYGKGSDHQEIRKRSPRDWLLDFMRAEIDCVAVTDHNTGQWIDPLKEEYELLRAEQHEEFRDLVLFPGVEITASGGIHMLAVFDPHKATSDVDALLGSVDFPMADRGTSDGCTVKSSLEVAQKIHAAGGLAIPAHVDRCSGIFKELSGQTLKAFLELSRVSAIEVVDTETEKPPIYQQSGLGLAQVIGSDSHHPPGTPSQRFPGSRFTWVKMGQPSLDGLRLALLDGEPLSVIRRDSARDSTTGDPNVRPRLTIERVEVTDGYYMGRQEPTRGDFSPWLSAIIGGRGTGKSTLIEMTRLALRRVHDLPEGLRTEFKNFATVPATRTGHGGLRKSTAVQVTFWKEGSRFRVNWRHDGAETAIEQETADGWHKSPGTVPSRFPVRILSQKQVFALAGDSGALLRLIDESESVKRGERKTRIQNAQAEYQSLQGQVRQLATQIADRERLEGELADVERQIALFEKRGHHALLRRYQRFRRQRQILRHRADELEANIVAVRGVADDVEPSDFASETFADTSVALDLIEQAASKQREVAESLRQQASDLRLFRDTWTKSIAASSWNKDAELTNKEYDDLVARLAKEGVDDPGAHGSLIQRQRILSERMHKLDTLEGKKQHLEQAAQGVLDGLEAERRALTADRKAFLSSILRNNSYVRIDVVPFGIDARAAEPEFRKALACEDKRFEASILSSDDAKGLLVELYGGLPKNQDDRVIEIASRIQKLKDDLAAIHTSGTGPPGMQRLWTHLRQQTPDQMDRLRMWWPEDGLRVQYRRATTGGLEPLRKGSPGQRSAAVLAFLLSYGDEPIILDQPEDDLDNHLIYDLIVNQIRENKHRRQVIVATHNPNIVVNGDAEMVIAMDHKAGQCIVSPDGTGCLQDVGVRAEVCRVMEGGRQAFEKRYRRLKEEFDSA